LRSPASTKVRQRPNTVLFFEPPKMCSSISPFKPQLPPVTSNTEAVTSNTRACSEKSSNADTSLCLGDFRDGKRAFRPYS
jgi:hypothetical protein